MLHRLRCAVAAAGLAVLLVSAAGCALLPGSTPTPPTVVVGVDLNLTGRADTPGTVFHNGLQQQLERVREQGLAGEAGLELRVLDNHGDPATSSANLAELSADPSVAAIITAGCPQCLIDIAGDLSVPVISLDGAEVVAAPPAERRWIFRIGPTAADNADALSLAMADAGAETVAVVAADDEYGDEGALWIADAAARDGLRIVLEQRIAPEAGDAVAAAAQQVTSWQPDLVSGGFGAAPPGEAAEGGPDAVVVWTYAAQAAELAEALREAEYGGRLFLDMIAADQLFLPREAAGLQGATLVFTPTPVADQRIGAAPALAARKTWFDAYTARFGTYHLHASFAADALLTLADAVRRAETPDRDTLRDRIETTRIDGMTGQIRFTNQQHSGLSANALVTLTASGDRWQ